MSSAAATGTARSPSELGMPHPQRSSAPFRSVGWPRRSVTPDRAYEHTSLIPVSDGQPLSECFYGRAARTSSARPTLPPLPPCAKRQRADGRIYRGAWRCERGCRTGRDPSASAGVSQPSASRTAGGTSMAARRSQPIVSPRKAYTARVLRSRPSGSRRRTRSRVSCSAAGSHDVPPSPSDRRSSAIFPVGTKHFARAIGQRELGLRANSTRLRRRSVRSRECDTCHRMWIARDTIVECGADRVAESIAREEDMRVRRAA